MQKRRLGPCVTFFPQPTTLISTRSEAGEVNLMTASWAGIVSKTPPTMAVSLNQGRQTYENIRATGMFGVNGVPSSLVLEADLCGVRSGRDLDKLEACHLDVEEGSVLPVPLLQQSPLNVECRFDREIEIGDYRLILGEIVEIHAVEAAFDEDGTIDATVFDPLVYLGGVREYWSLGERCGVAYRDGLKLLE